MVSGTGRSDIAQGRTPITLDEIAERISPVARSYGVDKIYVYGSYARGKADPSSDIDFLIIPGKVKGMKMGGLYRDLSDALNKRIDIITDRGDPEFIRMISEEMVLVYAD